MNDLMKSSSSNKRARYLAIVEALFTTLIWSSTFIIVKLGLETMGPLTIAGFRYMIGGLVLLPVVLLRKRTNTPISKSIWIRLILIGVSSYSIANGALFWGLKFVPATTGSFMLSLVPILVLAGGALFLQEKPTRWQVLGVSISFLGSGLFFSTGLLPGEPRGMFIISLGLFGFMAFSLLGRSIARDRQLDPLRLTTLPLLIGGVLSFFLAIIVEGIPHLSGASIRIVFWLAVINTALGYLLYNHALQELTALEVNMILNLSPFFTALLGWIFLGERIALIQLAGMLIMITGVILVQWTFRSNPEVN